jgi:predicted DNA-binding transcriptional regulator AlpA
MDTELLTIDDVAKLIHTSPGTIHYWRSVPEGRDKCPPAIKVGRRLLWRRADVERWLAAQPTSQSARDAG